ncbi:hypothetical protein [Aeromonas caviae]|uniref:hypothetical protein n=1 Tax=Aeromonas caviae TaxID=648 RepID=UPI001CC5E26E|nr:hypothetical protein [Aeromonas caviae]MCE9861802.1 hypothetical protein [Aeromonas caviae]MDH1454817.1 hypothetical protein [Aeromonas caviae]
MIAFVVMMVIVSVVMVVILAVTVRMVAMTVPKPRVLGVIVVAAAGHGENSLLMAYAPH